MNENAYFILNMTSFSQKNFGKNTSMECNISENISLRMKTISAYFGINDK